MLRFHRHALFMLALLAAGMPAALHAQAASTLAPEQLQVYAKAYVAATRSCTHRSTRARGCASSWLSCPRCW
jgi:hypothetical protein